MKSHFCSRTKRKVYRSLRLSKTARFVNLVYVETLTNGCCRRGYWLGGRCPHRRTPIGDWEHTSVHARCGRRARVCPWRGEKSSCPTTAGVVGAYSRQSGAETSCYGSTSKCLTIFTPVSRFMATPFVGITHTVSLLFSAHRALDWL